MRTRTTITLIAAAVAAGLTVSGASAADASPRHRFDRVMNAHTSHDAASPDDQDAPTDEGISTYISGAPAPIFRTPNELASGAVTVATGDVLIITNNDGALWTGTGGATDAALATFTGSSHDDEASFNAAFTITGTGTTTAWVTDKQGHRTDFTITVTTE